MNRIDRRTVLLCGAAAAIGWPAGRASGQLRKAVPGQQLNISASAPPAAAASASLSLGTRSSKVTPLRTGCTHTGGGNIDVQQPAPDTVVITMTGVAIAYGGPTGGAEASLVFDLVQQFDVSIDGAKAAKLAIEGRLIGLLRNYKTGSAEVSAGATVGAGTGTGLIALVMPEHRTCSNESLSINDKESPNGVVVKAGSYTFCQSFRVAAAMPGSLLPRQAPSAEFAPDPALDPLWISSKEPFKGAKKADFGFQVTLKASLEAGK